MQVPNLESNAEAINVKEKIEEKPVEPVQSVEPKPEPEKKEQPEDPNWRAFREARKKDRAEKEAAERRAAEKEAEVTALKAAMEAAFSKSAPTPQAYQQYYGQEQEETEDQRLEKKLNALLETRERQYRQQQEERERQELPTRLARDFPDFKNVVTQESLDYMDYHYPEISRPLQRLGDSYDKWHDVYHAVKKFVPNHSGVQGDIKRAETNALKPKSISSAQQTPTGEPVRTTSQEVEKRREENWLRMQRIMKGV